MKKLSNRSRSKLLTVAGLVLFAGLAGGLFNFVTTGMQKASEIWYGAVDGLLIGGLLSYYTFFLMRDRLRPALRTLNFTAMLLVNSLVYLGLFLGGRALGYFLTARSESISIGDFFGGNFAQAVAFVFLLMIVINFVHQISLLVGPNVLASFVTGTYHRPVEEERIFMFLDLEASTQMAEALGNHKFHQLLNRFFYGLTDAVVETKGEIYKYVGDEVIVTWKMRQGLDDAHCLRCFFLIEEQVQRDAAAYRRDFGLVPGFRAGLHSGPVVVGELGDVKQEIAFLGDVLNATARIAAHCKEQKCRLLVSGRVMDALCVPEDLIVTPLGTFQPRGKQESLPIYRVESGAYDEGG